MAGGPNLLFGKFPGNFIKQKNIPVGCVPSAAVAVPRKGVSIGSVSDGRGVSAWEVCLTGVSDRGVVCPGGVFSWRVGVCPGGGGVCPGGGCVSGLEVWPGGVCPGGVCPGGVCPGGVCPAGRAVCPEGVSAEGLSARQPLWTDSQTPVKT